MRFWPTGYFMPAESPAPMMNTRFGRNRLIGLADEGGFGGRRGRPGGFAIATSLFPEQGFHSTARRRQHERCRKKVNLPAETALFAHLPNQSERGRLSKRLGGQMTRGQRAAGVLTALFLVATFIVAFYILCKVWPGGPDPVVPPPNSPADAGSITVFGQRVVLTLELRQILLAMFAGVVGNLIASLLSFASYVGNRKLTASWLPWYVLNPFIGGGIAVLFYFAYRAGLVTAGSASGVVSAYGIAAIASLSGMFSKNAADKLKEIFDVAFHAKEDAKRADKLGPLTIAAISPARFVKGSPDAEITVTGAGFVEGSVVRINGNDRKTAFVSSGTLRATLLASDFATSASLRLRVINPDGSTSGESALSVV